MSKNDPVNGQLQTIASNLSTRLRLFKIWNNRDWSTVPPDSLDAELDRVAQRFPPEWGEQCVRSFAEHYVFVKTAGEQGRALDGALGGVAPHLAVLANVGAHAFRSQDGPRISTLARELAALVTAEESARVGPREAARAVRTAIGRAGGAARATEIRQLAAADRLPNHHKEWAYRFAMLAYEDGLGPTEVAKLEALVAHEFFAGIRTEMTGTIYPIGTRGSARGAVARWEAAFKKIGFGAPERPRAKFSAATGRVYLV